MTILDTHLIDTLVQDKIYIHHDTSKIHSSFFKLLMQFQAWLNRPVFFCNYHSEATEQLVKDLKEVHPKLFVIYYPDSSKQPFARAYNDLKYYYIPNNLIGSPEGSGRNIRLDNGTVVNSLVYNSDNIWYNYDALNHIRESQNIENHYYNNISTKFIPYYDENRDRYELTPAEYDKKKSIEHLHGFIQSQYVKSKRKLVLEINDLSAKNRELHRIICTNNRLIDEKIVLKNSLIGKESRKLRKFYDINQITKSIDNLFRMGYNKIANNGDLLEAYTDDIIINYESRDYLIGQFMITIDFTNTTIKLVNITRQYVANSREEEIYDHPHISRGYACFGNYKNEIYKLLEKQDYIDLLTMLMVFLKEYNDGRYGGRPYVIIKHWENDTMHAESSTDFDEDEETEETTNE